MSMYFRFHDYFYSPPKILEQIGIRAGSKILDFDVGSGSYSIPAAQLVGPTGKVYAIDIYRFAIKEISKKTDTQRIKNIYTQYTLIAILNYQMHL